MIHFREAVLSDIPQIQIVRNSVKENVLSDPSRVTDQDCAIYLSQRGRGWVCTSNDIVVGFAIADLVEDNIWALFMDPAFEGRGLGGRLHFMMLDWYFRQGRDKVWLSTAAQSRAAFFYQKKGWTPAGITSSGELKFEMTAADWAKCRQR